MSRAFSAAEIGRRDMQGDEADEAAWYKVKSSANEANESVVEKDDEREDHDGEKVGNGSGG